MDEKLKRVVYYIRVSTEEQKIHGLSLDAQRMKLDEYAQAHNFVYVGTYADEGISGRKPIKKRPQLQKMLQDAQNNLFDLIIFIKLDRYFRSVAEYHECQKILDKYGIQWTATEEKYDLTTANGRAFVNMKLTIAELEADQTSERIKLVNDYKVKEGYALTGKIPFGFKLQRKDGHSVVVRDEENAHIIYEMIKQFETFKNIYSLQRYLIDTYSITRSCESIKRTLKTPLLYGTYRGNSNYCEPYISKERYDKIQDIFNEFRQRWKPPKRIYLFSGLVYCGTCGCRMGSNYACPKSDNIIRLTYKCTGYRILDADGEPLDRKRWSKSEFKIERFLLDNLKSKLREYIVSVEDEKNNSKADIKAKLKKLETEKDKLNYILLGACVGMGNVVVYDLS